MNQLTTSRNRLKCKNLILVTFIIQQEYMRADCVIDGLQKYSDLQQLIKEKKSLQLFNPFWHERIRETGSVMNNHILFKLGFKVIWLIITNYFKNSVY